MALTINEIVRDVAVPKDKREFTNWRTFIVQNTDSSINVLADAGIPQTGDAHPDYPGLRVIDATCTVLMNDENVLTYKVEVCYVPHDREPYIQLQQRQ